MKTTHRLVLALTLTALPAYVCAETAGPSAAPNDAQIAAIVVAANQVDIDAGRFAAAKSSDSTVKKFAEMMITDHTSVNQSAVALVTKLKVTPESNDTSKALQDGGDKNLTHLRSLDGKAFDQAYVDHEVAYHEQVIAALDTALIPNAQNAELKALLVKVRPAFIAHLGHAKKLQAALDK
jgi:putative membrane protein